MEAIVESDLHVHVGKSGARGFVCSLIVAVLINIVNSCCCFKKTRLNKRHSWRLKTLSLLYHGCTQTPHFSRPCVLPLCSALHLAARGL